MRKRLFARSLRALPIAATLLAGAAVGGLTPRDAHAQPAATGGDDAVKEVARQRYADGVKAFDSGKYEDARLAFAQAHQLTQAPGILLNLGLSEIRTNRPVEGGNHLFQFLREYKEATPEQKAGAIQGIEEAKKKAGLVSITVDVPGADVSIDGTLVGKSPLPDPVFVPEGGRTIVATANGKNAMAKVDAKRGQVTQASVVFNAAPAPGPEPVAPGPGPAVAPGPGPVMQPGPVMGPVFPPPQVQPDRGGGKDFGSWFIQSPIAWVGTGLTAVGLGLGIGFSVAASQSASDADDIANAIRDQADEDGLQDSPCGPEDGTGAGDAYPGPCNALRDALGVRDANVAVAVVGWVLFGLAAGGTTAYILIEYPKASKGSAKEAGPRVGLLPVVSPDMTGAALMGSF
ncbi:MAG: hypothetical protein JNL21_23945 [Myxococcales bacterium]|nr:hypothetical protein [Myxococcales bacterium]